MSHSDDDGQRLSILLSAVSSVLRGTGAIASLKTAQNFHVWDNGIETIVEVSISVSKLRVDTDVEAVRAAVIGYAPTKATIDRMQKEIDELKKGPDHQENSNLRAQVADYARRAAALERQIAAAESRSAPIAASTRIAALEGEVANLRKQLNVAPPAEQDDRDPAVVRASLLELT